MSVLREIWESHGFLSRMSEEEIEQLIPLLTNQALELVGDVNNLSPPQNHSDVLLQLVRLVFKEFQCMPCPTTRFVESDGSPGDALKILPLGEFELSMGNLRERKDQVIAAFTKLACGKTLYINVPFLVANVRVENGLHYFKLNTLAGTKS